MRNVGLEEAQVRIKIAGRSISNLRYADDTTLRVESEELKGLLMIVREMSEKVGLKLNIQKAKIMASSPITSWQIGKQWKQWLTLFFGGSKITVDGDCSQEIKRCFLFGRKVMTNLDSILKSRHYFVNKGPSSQGYGFSSGCAWMWELDYKESWRPRIDAFELWCWRRLLRVPWTARRSNQSILNEISPGCSLEGLMLKLKLQCFSHLMLRADPFQITLMLGNIEGRRRGGWDGWIAPPTQWTWVWVNSGSWWWTGKPDVLQFMELQRVRHNWATELNFPNGTVVKNLPASAWNARDMGSIPMSGRSLSVGNGNPFQYSCLDNSMDRGAWRAIVYGFTKSWTWLRDLASTHIYIYI